MKNKPTESDRHPRRLFLARSLKALAGVAAGVSAIDSPAASRRSSPRARAERTAFGEGAEETNPNAFVMHRMKFASLNPRSHWDSHKQSDDIFLQFVGRETSIPLSSLSWDERVVDIDDSVKIYESPFLFMSSTGKFRFSGGQVKALGEFFKRGGFLYGDECSGSNWSVEFYNAFKQQIPRALPGVEMKPMPKDHAIYRCLYDLPAPAPKPTGKMHPDLGLFHQDRLVSFLTPSDVHCGWGAPGYAPFQDACLKMGGNIVFYSLTH